MKKLLIPTQVGLGLLSPRELKMLNHLHQQLHEKKEFEHGQSREC